MRLTSSMPNDRVVKQENQNEDNNYAGQDNQSKKESVDPGVRHC
jgi:hypothetical protein